MNGWAFIASVVASVLSWPVLVLVIVLIFQKPLRELIGRIKSYEGLGQRVTFGGALAETEDKVDAAVGTVDLQADSLPQEEATVLLADDLYVHEWNALQREAEDNPSYVIVTAWERLSAAIDELLAQSGAVSSERARWRPDVARLQALAAAAVVNDDFVGAAIELRQLRNRVAHGDHKPSPGEAAAYTESAMELARAAKVLAAMSPQRSRTQS